MLETGGENLRHISTCKSLTFKLAVNLYKLNPFPNKPVFFSCLLYESSENTVGKEEIARNKQFLLFRQRFQPFQKTLHYFHQIKKICLQTLQVKTHVPEF